MSLDPGHKLAHYEIVEPIGKGGMGEVYRARDSKLGRDVAIKVLPDEFARDDERLRRFQREAKVLASLNHPNIAAIYGLEHSGEVHYLVLELVPGETLADQIARGPIPVDEAIVIASKIAEALEEAHEQGIVHRDLKPANVKLTPDDKVKVLDFGLAKAFVEEDSEGDAVSSMSPTITRDATRVGVILGTAAYMSPEQAKGKKVDKRTDIFAFGVVLFEMLTGEKAFGGEEVSDVLASVIKTEPKWRLLPRVPERITTLLRRCLDKNAKSRLRDIGEARLALQGAVVADDDEVSARGGRRIAWIATALGLGIVLGAIVMKMATSGSPSNVSRNVSRATIKLPEGQTQPRSLYQPLAISPDGTKLAYVAEDETGPNLFLREMNSFEARKLPDTAYASMPFFSPDGRWIGFFTTSALKKIAVDQGPPVTLTRVPYGLGGSWGEDDTIVYADQSTGLYRISAAGGSAEQLTKPDFASGGYSHLWPSHLTDGQRVLFTVFGGSSPNSTAVLDLESHEWQVERANMNAALPLASGHLIFSDDNRSLSLLATQLDSVDSDAFPVIEDIVSGTFAQRHFAAVSTTGTLVYAPSVREGEQLQWLHPDGALTPILSYQSGMHQPRLSSDGNRVAFLDNKNEMWIAALRTGSPDLVDQSAPDSSSWNPTWSPDGLSLTFGSNRNQRDWDLYEMKPGEEPVPLLVKQYDQGPESWSPDGSVLVFVEFHPETGLDLWSLLRDGEPEPLIVTPANESEAVISPDGRWLAYVSDQTGRFQVYVREFPNGTSAVVSTDVGEEPMWSSDGRELYFRRGPGLYAVTLSGGSDWTASPPRLVVSQPFDRNVYREHAAYDVAPDGRFLVVTGTSNTELEVVFNWFSELERLVPTE